MHDSINRWPRWLAALLVAVGTFSINYWRYETFRTAGPFDLAFFNHQHWNFWHGQAPITLRTQNALIGEEGPEPWRTTHMRPISLVITLLYPFVGSIAYLYCVQSLALAAGVFPAANIATRISGSESCGTKVAWMYAVAPVVWLVGANDFRYMYLAVPVVLWLFDAIDRRNPGNTLLGLLLLATIRAPLSIVAGMLGVTQLFRRKGFTTNLRWCTFVGFFAVIWFVGYVGYLYLLFGEKGMTGFLRATFDPAAAYGKTPGRELMLILRQAGGLLAILGPLIVAGIFAPELIVIASILSIPPLRMGLYTVHPAQHYVRYTTPTIIFLLIAMCVSIGRLTRWNAVWGKRFSTIATALLSTGFVIQLSLVFSLPSRIDAPDVAELRKVLKEVSADSIVMGPPVILPHVSSRTEVYNYYQLPAGCAIEEVVARSDWLIIEKRQTNFVKMIEPNEAITTAHVLDDFIVYRKAGNR